MRNRLTLFPALLCTAVLVCGQTEGPSSSVPSSPSGATAKVSLPPVADEQTAPAHVTTEATPAPQSAPPKVEKSVPGELTPGASPEKSDAAGPKPAPEPEKSAAGVPAAGATTPAKSPVAESGHKPYIFGPLDVVIVKIWNLDKLSGVYSIGADGMFSMPLVGTIKAEGMTTRQLTDAVTQRLKDCCLNNPEGVVDVQVGKNNSKRFYVYGSVGRQGEYPLDREDYTVMDAMANVGGFGAFAKRKKIRILRGTKTFYFNYEEVSKGKKLDQNIVIQNGDRIFVDE